MYRPCIGLDDYALPRCCVQVLDLKTRRQAATALRDLAANDEYKLQYAEEGGIEALVGTPNHRPPDHVHWSGCSPIIRST